MTRISQNHGLTLTEVIIAALIFTIAVAGVFASLSAVRSHPNLITDRSLAAALCGQKFLESLRAGVDQRDWNSGMLQVRGATALPQCEQDGQMYDMSYQVIDDGHGRKATVTVTW